MCLAKIDLFWKWHKVFLRQHIKIFFFKIFLSFKTSFFLLKSVSPSE